MHVYILRHGIAHHASPEQLDRDRALTNEGREKLEQILKRARKAEVRPWTILSSPFRRAIETARMAADILDCENLRETRVLEPSGTPEEVWEEIRLYLDDGPVMIVGHQPLLGDCVTHLLAAPGLAVNFKKGALAAISTLEPTARPRGVLEWILTAKLCG